MKPYIPNRIVVLSIWAEDVPNTAHFYKDVLGLEHFSHHFDGSDRPHFKVGNTFLTILKGKPAPAEESDPVRFPLFALGVEDLDAAVERLKAYGVDLPWGIEEGQGIRWVMFYDPAGNLIELT